MDVRVSFEVRTSSKERLTEEVGDVESRGAGMADRFEVLLTLVVGS